MVCPDEIYKRSTLSILSPGGALHGRGRCRGGRPPGPGAERDELNRRELWSSVEFRVPPIHVRRAPLLGFQHSLGQVLGALSITSEMSIISAPHIRLLVVAALVRGPSCLVARLDRMVHEQAPQSRRPGPVWGVVPLRARAISFLALRPAGEVFIKRLEGKCNTHGACLSSCLEEALQCALELRPSPHRGSFTNFWRSCRFLGTVSCTIRSLELAQTRSRRCFLLLRRALTTKHGSEGVGLLRRDRIRRGGLARLFTTVAGGKGVRLLRGSAWTRRAVVAHVFHFLSPAKRTACVAQNLHVTRVSKSRKWFWCGPNTAVQYRPYGTFPTPARSERSRGTRWSKAQSSALPPTNFALCLLC